MQSPFSADPIQPEKHRNHDQSSSEADKAPMCAIHGIAMLPVVDLPPGMAQIAKENPRAWDCPQCSAELMGRKTREIHEEFDQKRINEEQQRRQVALEARIGAAGIPARYRAYSFDTFPAASDRARHHRDTLRSYANSWRRVSKQGVSVLLVGGIGTGKTGLACSVANAVMREHGGTALFMTAYGAVRHQRDAWGRKGKTERDALDDLVTADLLVLDEVGTAVGTDAELAMLFEVLNGRYQDQRPTILCSNLPIKDFETPKGPRPGLEAYLGQRVLSRFTDDQSFTLTFDWPSIRGADL